MLKLFTLFMRVRREDKAEAEKKRMAQIEGEKRRETTTTQSREHRFPGILPRTHANILQMFASVNVQLFMVTLPIDHKSKKACLEHFRLGRISTIGARIAYVCGEYFPGIGFAFPNEQSFGKSKAE